MHEIERDSIHRIKQCQTTTVIHLGWMVLVNIARLGFVEQSR